MEISDVLILKVVVVILSPVFCIKVDVVSTVHIKLVEIKEVSLCCKVNIEVLVSTDYVIVGVTCCEG